MVVDLINISEQLKYWAYPLMRIDRMFSKLKNRQNVHKAQWCNIFSTLDVKFSNYNITVAEDRWKYTAFTTQYRGCM